MKILGSIEKMSLFASIFFLAFGTGLIVDGKKTHQEQLRASKRVDYKSTLSPYKK
jgi:hypothetical protein